jgi:hypothetical protein
MKNWKHCTAFAFFAIITLAINIITCDNESGSNGGNGLGNNGSGVETAGRLTITGLSEYNGKYAYGVSHGQPALHAAASLDDNNYAKMIENGSVMLKVWKMDRDNPTHHMNYDGNDKDVLFAIGIVVESMPIESGWQITTRQVFASFTNGIAAAAITN